MIRNGRNWSGSRCFFSTCSVVGRDDWPASVPICQTHFMKDKNKRSGRLPSNNITRRLCIRCCTSCCFLTPQLGSLSDQLSWVLFQGKQIRVPYISNICTITENNRAPPPDTQRDADRAPFLCVMCCDRLGLLHPPRTGRKKTPRSAPIATIPNHLI